jgi:hypothetical protein
MSKMANGDISGFTSYLARMEKSIIYSGMTPHLIAGVLSGVAGLLIFLVIHHFWIAPIWSILPVGLVIAGLGGLALGWSYVEIRVGLPHRPWTFLVLVALFGAILAPSVLIAQLREPLIDIATGIIPPEERVGVIAHFILELLVTATALGGLAGWLLGRTWQAVIATALAGLVFALGPGHNVPFLGNTAVTGRGLAILLAIILVSAIVLVEADAWLVKG